MIKYGVFLDISKKLRVRLVKNFMDIIVLSQLRKSSSLSGYDIMSYIHGKLGLLMSPSTVYSLLYRLERDGLVEGEWNHRKRVYTLTGKGDIYIKLIQRSSERIPLFIMEIFGERTSA